MKILALRSRLILPLLIATILLSGCLSETESFIQGTWEFEEDHLKNLTGEQHLTATWAFDRGTFYHRACCFNIDLEIRGRYRVLDLTDDTITIELFDVRGSEYRFNQELRLAIDQDTDTLKIQNAGPYIRISP